MQTPPIITSRLTALRAKMQKNNITGLLVLRPENRRYLSGYKANDAQLDESSGCLLITRRRQFLLTDFRYKTQAEKEAAGFDVLIYQAGPVKLIGALVRRLKIKILGFEDDFMTCRIHNLLTEELTGVEIKSSDGLVEDLRQLKDDDEVGRITKALRITEAALAKTIDFLEPGRTELETARFFENTILQLGADGIAFDTIVASGPNAALPHAVPGKRKIKSGETVIIDCGAKLNGYCSDMTRTIIHGAPPNWIKEIYMVVRKAQLQALKDIKPGMMSGEADEIARSVIEKAGFGQYFGHSLGHGVGLATHEAPSLSRLRPRRLQPGMIITIEPGIYLEGRGGVRLEEMVLITENKARLLNRDKYFYDWS